MVKEGVTTLKTPVIYNFEQYEQFMKKNGFWSERYKPNEYDIRSFNCYGYPFIAEVSYDSRNMVSVDKVYLKDFIGEGKLKGFVFTIDDERKIVIAESKEKAEGFINYTYAYCDIEYIGEGDIENGILFLFA